jgi:hypothetical protein
MPDFLTESLVALGVALRADVNALEVALLVVAAWCVHRGWLGAPPWCGRLESAGRSLARRPRLAVLGVVLLTVAARLALLPLVPLPHPGGSDEFSHLLLGDTLAHGRLTNPSHPMWVHLESRHILQQPTYNSMYFPGQGAFLALGKVLFGHPWAGVLASTALLCGAITWMLQGWFSPGWALAGGLLAILRIGLVSYWANSFWGGSVPALGGALVLGAYPRLRQGPRPAHAVLLAAGLALMAVSRPFEGLAFALPVAVALGAWALSRRGPGWRAMAGRLVLPVVLVLALTGLAMALYFRAVTGSPAVLPYQVSQRTYGWPMTLVWQDPPRVEHRHKQLRDYYNWELAEHESLKSPGAAAIALMHKGVLLWSFYFGPALSAPLLLALGSLATRRIRLVLLAGAATLVATLLEQSSYPHYVSPATCVVFALIVNAMQQLAKKDELKHRFARAVFAIVVVALAFRLAAKPLGVPLRGPQLQMSWCCSDYRPNDRWPFERRLRAAEGRQLVVVRYGGSAKMGIEWVYNEADIDASKIVWARDMGEAANRELIRYYPDRRVWLGEPDAVPPIVRPYPAGP